MSEILNAVQQLGTKVTERHAEMKQNIEKLEAEIKTIRAKGNTLNGGGGSVEPSISLEGQREAFEAFRSGKTREFTPEVKSMTLGASLTGPGASISAPARLVSEPNQAVRLRTLFPNQPMITSSLPIIQETGQVGGFGTVAESAEKPTLDFALSETPAKAETIAAIVNISRQMLMDLDYVGFQGWLNTRLIELYYQKEDQQLMQGNGTSPNLKGLLDVGNWTPAATPSSTNDVEQIVSAMIQLKGYGRTPTAIIVHTSALAGLLLNKASGSGEFDLPNYISVNAFGGISILGVPVIDSQAQETPNFSVVDGSRMLFGVREPISINMFEQHGTNVQTNMITIRCEARVAFAANGEYNHILGAFSGSPTYPL
ncbi:phage major capsid protein [Flavihumibacter sp. ZG627]|uniref:phage major capsid protein n=1 Tax=Flavihumibacter sp. ZG627 TaxID=1463156 RepID=UPI00057CDAFF|nr:phage major capsid protein [Flavihumibacter sp. ZG627]KIC90002.1 hypothetical protein HY58_13410 [Flavihumibacter sp. ZG627]